VIDCQDRAAVAWLREAAPAFLADPEDNEFCCLEPPK